ncbi:MAG TPA: preprotein translocase subunit YajC [Acidobacteriota bacterium]|nr:preprotein translocase subunit YajC [Acidobacteriota bacterium]
MILGAAANLAGQAGGAQVARPNMLGALLPFVLVFVIFYLLIIMPQRKKQKKHLELVDNLKPGDKIITTAGIFGTVMGVNKDLIELKISSNTNIKITKSAVGVIRGANDRLEGE